MLWIWDAEGHHDKNIWKIRCCHVQVKIQINIYIYNIMFLSSQWLQKLETASHYYSILHILLLMYQSLNKSNVSALYICPDKNCNKIKIQVLNQDLNGLIGHIQTNLNPKPGVRLGSFPTTNQLRFVNNFKYFDCKDNWIAERKSW